MAPPAGPYTEGVASDLRSFIRLLEARGQLRRVSVEVSANLEIAEIADRLVKNGGPAVLFEHVTGSPFPLVIGLMGSSERMAWALGGASLNDVAARVRGLFDLAGSGNLLAVAANLGKARDLLNIRPRRVRRAPVQEVVWRGDAVNLAMLPVLKCWPLDGGPFVTLPLVITKDPETGEPNMGMYRMQVYDRNTTGMHWQRHKTGARHLALARERGERLPVAVALGGDPTLIYAATAPLPPVPGVNEFALAGFLNRRAVRVTRALTVPLDVPADAEFVLEGYVDPLEAPRVEGPFGDHTGYYTLPDDYPVFHVTAVTMRRDAIYPATIVGRPPMEDAFLIEASERLFLEPARMVLPELVDYAMPAVGVAHNLVNASMKKSYPGQAYKLANGLLGLGQMMFAKVIVVVDDGAPVQDALTCLSRALTHCLPGRDTLFTRGPMDVLDHSSRGWSFGSKLILDGTFKSPEEGGEQPLQDAPDAPAPTHELLSGWARLAPGLLVLSLHGLPRRESASSARAASAEGGMLTHSKPALALQAGEAVASSGAGAGARLVLVVNDDVNPGDANEVLWTVLNNIDPERDGRVVSGPSGPVLVLDGTEKLADDGFARTWPPKIVMDAGVKARVQERWEEYGLG